MTAKIENVVLIVVDALRADRVGAYSGDELTPNMDSLAKDGEVFEQCYSCVNATDSSITTILTGLYPTHHGIINHGKGITEEEQGYVSGTTPLPDLLSDTHNNIGIDTLERWHQRGFDTYINPRGDMSNRALRKLSDALNHFPSPLENKIKDTYRLIAKKGEQQILSDVITNEAVEFVEKNNQPFFLFAHYWDAHIPYLSEEHHPEKIEKRSYDGSENALQDVLKPIKGSLWEDRLATRLAGDSTTVSEMKRKYDAGVWKADQAIGEIIKELKNKDIYDNTAVIVTADHGESFTEHGIIFDHHGLYDPTIHVPLIIRAPGFEGRESQYVQHFDLAPTILDLLGQDYKNETFDGVSLVNQGDSRSLDRDAIFVEEGHTARKRAIRTDTYKYIKRLDDRNMCEYCGIKHAENEELYDLQRDPEEQQNIIKENIEVRDKLDEQLESWVDGIAAPSKEKIAFEPSDEVKEHLEEMGYI